jgi:hypothetical protein
MSLQPGKGKETCKAYGQKCNYCKKDNHYAHACKARARDQSAADKSKNGKLKALGAAAADRAAMPGF